MKGDVVTVVQVLAAGLVGLRYDGDVALWTIRVLRKDAKCARCGRVLRRGDRAFGPMGNKLYRYARLCLSCACDQPEKRR